MAAPALIERERAQFVVVYELDVPGPPVGKGRPRLVRESSACPGRGAMRVATPLQTRQWEKRVKALVGALYRGERLKGPVALRVESYKARPKNLCRKKDAEGAAWCMAVPDGDNILKIVADAMVKSGIIKDDAQVVRWSIDTLYAAPGEEPYVSLELCVLEGFEG